MEDAMTGDDEGEGIASQGSAHRPGRIGSPYPSGNPPIGADPAPRDLKIGQEDPTLKLRTPIEGNPLQIKIHRLAFEKPFNPYN
jgi:hypothetical protein